MSGIDGARRPARLVDSHAHLTMVAGRGIPLAEALSTWFASGGSRLLDAGTEPGDLSGRRQALETALSELASRGSEGEPLLPSDPPDDAIIFSAGAWPGKAVLSDPDASLVALEVDLDSGAVAVGECGLDYFHGEAPRDRQIAFFQSCCAAARRRGLPLIVHSRDAFEDTLSCVLGADLAKPAIIHCFSYDAQAARSFLDAGCLISFAGSLTYKNAQGLREAAALVPLDRLLVETDAPYLSPVPHRGRICRPEMVADTLECLARVKGIRLEELAERVEENFLRAFSR